MVKVLSFRNEAPNIDPHAEYVTERRIPCRSSEIALTSVPVWRSQLINRLGFSPNHVNKREFGEKPSHLVSPIPPDGKSSTVRGQRVTPSRTSIVALAFPRAIAMNLLHGDHTAVSIAEENLVAVIFCSHEVDSPCAILTSGRACCLYRVHTIDSLGDSGRAEW